MQEELIIQLHSNNKIIFIPSGRLGNAIFRYLAGALINILNPSFDYTLLKDFHEENDNDFTYYPGVDHEGDDLMRNTLEEVRYSALINPNAVGYNTLGYLKHTIDCETLKSNAYINKENGQGLYVKNCITLNDQNFLQSMHKKLKNFHVKMDGFFQFGHIYLKYKTQLLNYMHAHKRLHSIQTDIHQFFLIQDLLDDIPLPPEKQYDMVIHIRLGDFNGRPDYIEATYYLALFETIDFTGKSICFLYDALTGKEDYNYLQACTRWFQERHIPFVLESNSLIVDFNIMKQAKILISSMSTLAWAAAYLSKHLQQCYMPNYNFYKNVKRRDFYFRKPIEQTILYPVKTTNLNLSAIKTFIITLPVYANKTNERLNKLDHFRQQFSYMGLETEMYNGVHGKDIIMHDTSNQMIKQISYKEETLSYNRTIRLNGLSMTKGEFGCAWSHLNLLKQLLQERITVGYYLILEDDVELVKPLDELYELFHHLPTDMDLIHLAKSEWYPFKKTSPSNAYFYECEKQFFNKTTAYLVSKKGAEKILAYAENAIHVPIDDLFNMIFRLTPDFRFYVPHDYFFKEQENVISIIKTIDENA